MPGSTNFIQWNPNCNNQESDVAYNSDTQRSGGAISGPSIFASNLANKLFYQCSIFIAAFANRLTLSGYSPNDGSASPSTALANLQSVFQNVLTFADVTFAYLVSVLGFTPVQQGTGANQNNANAVKLGNDILNSGRIRATLGGTDEGPLVYLKDTVVFGTTAAPTGTQRMQVGTFTGSGSNQPVFFPVAFSGVPFVFLGPEGGTADIHSGTRSTTGFNLDCSGFQTVCWMAIGPSL